MTSVSSENEKRFVAVLNKKTELGRSLNVLGHLSVGLTNQLEADEALFVDYQDGDGGIHPSLSHYPFIVLKANNSNKIRKARELAIEQGIKFTDFTHTMIEGGSTVQQHTTNQTKEQEFEYLGIAFFGDSEALRNITKKFSLYK
ncbi:DUF2000 domain-containing protein [Photobacterium sanguinicancri]|uniref:DUF2000 domain-containing protein n=1 Tax=Photobacterium sanguinicancri TaxID=875932 RepID=A0AAW7Y209_9GAMM|nr:DUF2000 domain-containing protein [Photobacterium sanguinicancri]MDO6542100.1 DUF2000 domain-containing protein [Photobacterium sanguinicancri]